MHSVLAVAASHLYELGGDCKDHSVAKVLYWQRSVQDFQEVIASRISQENSDAVILTAVLLNILSFSHVESLDPLTSWVFSRSPNRLDWLRLQLGLRELLLWTRSFRENTVLMPMFGASGNGQGPFHDLGSGTEGIPQQFIELFMLNVDSNASNNVYHRPIQLLALCIELEIKADNLFLLLQFVGGLDGRFIELLLISDHRAMLILAYWLSLMCGMNFWWCLKRARTDCFAICLFLDRNIVDQRVRSLLWFPAERCGYKEASHNFASI